MIDPVPNVSVCQNVQSGEFVLVNYYPQYKDGSYRGNTPVGELTHISAEDFEKRALDLFIKSLSDFSTAQAKEKLSSNYWV